MEKKSTRESIEDVRLEREKIKLELDKCELETKPVAIDIPPSFIQKYGTIYYASKDATKSELEFNRYKQDCRKRALEMAHNEAIKAYDNQPIAHSVLIKKADDYYEWLTKDLN